jgi:DNA-directed RNA polymerase subunit RPC12/RpoP
MNKDWVTKTLTKLEQIWPSWIASKGCLNPTEALYREFANHERIPAAVTSLCEHVGLCGTATIDIVHDSHITALDFITGQRFDTKTINAAADVRSTSLITMKIRLAVRQLASPRKLARILAHEATHHILNMANIHAESDIENEMFTDVAAVFLGFGKLMLTGAAEEPPDMISVPITKSDEGIPYLGYPLIAFSYFVWSKSKGLDTEGSLSHVVGPCVRFLQSFEYYHVRGRCLWTRLLAHFRNIAPEPECDGTVVFEECKQGRSTKFNIITCGTCGAKLRIPSTDKTLSVTCPKCKSKFTMRLRPISRNA